jgi:WD40 repeat protein
MSKLAFRSGLQRCIGLACLILPAISSCSDSSSEKAPGRTVKRPLLTIRGNTGSVTRVAYSPDGKRIASCHCEPPGRADSDDPRVAPRGPSERPQDKVLREVKIWDAQTGEERISINQGIHTRGVVFYPDGQHLAGAVANRVEVWDTTTAKETLVIKGHTDIVDDLDISPDGKRMVTGSYDGTVKAWDTATGACLHTLRGHTHEVFHVSFSPDGKRVASTGEEEGTGGEIRVWDVTAEKQVLSLTHDTLIGRAVFSPDGERLASVSNEGGKDTRPGLVEVWNASSGELLFVRKAHQAAVNCIAYSPDGKRLATGSEDGTVIVRDAVTGEEMLTLGVRRELTSFFSHITSIAFSPDGDRLASSSWEGTVKIWDLKDLKPDKDANAERTNSH